jgi:hypothetical protein
VDIGGTGSGDGGVIVIVSRTRRCDYFVFSNHSAIHDRNRFVLGCSDGERRGNALQRDAALARLSGYLCDERAFRAGNGDDRPHPA